MKNFMIIQGMYHSLSLRETARDARNDRSFIMVVLCRKIYKRY